MNMLPIYRINVHISPLAETMTTADIWNAAAADNYLFIDRGSLPIYTVLSGYYAIVINLRRTYNHLNSNIVYFK